MIPFHQRILLLAVGMLSRLRIIQTPAFSNMKKEKKQARQPILDVFRHYPREVLVAMGARFVENGAFYLYTVFVLVYATDHVRMDRSIVLTATLIAATCELIAIPLCGAFSAVISRKPVDLIGACC